MPVSFSIIVPYRNTSLDDRREMLDALEQSIPQLDDIEIIWVDDHSPLQWTPPQTSTGRHVHLHLPDGVRFAGSARNLGLSMASGKWVLFADSDDLFDTAALADILDTVRNDVAADLILFRSGSFRPDGEPGQRHEFISDLVQEFIATGSMDILVRYNSPVGKIIRKSFLLDHGLFFSPTRHGNDVLFGASLAFSNPRTRAIDRAAYFIRESEHGLTQAIDSKSLRERFAVFHAFQALKRKHGREDLTQSHFGVLRRYFRANPTACLLEGLRILTGRPSRLPFASDAHTPHLPVREQGSTR